MSMHAYTPVLHTGTDAARAADRDETDALGKQSLSFAYTHGLLGGRPPGGTHTRQNGSRKTAPSLFTRTDRIQTPCIAYSGPFLYTRMHSVEREAAPLW
jgi:hypothetical protein